jgi:nitrogen fixation/metabolism regulation signal transduction histidine kinase
VKDSLLNKLYSVNGLLLTAFLFFSLSFIFNRMYTGKTSLRREAGLLQDYIHTYERKFENFLSDTQLVKKILDDKVTKHELEQLTSDELGIYLFYEDDFGNLIPRFWSHQLVFPKEVTPADKEEPVFQQLDNGFYVQLKKTLRLAETGRNIYAYALIAVAADYFIESPYLPKEFYYNKDASKRIVISENRQGEPIKSVAGVPLFFVEKNNLNAIPYNNWLTVFLRLSGLFFLMLFFHFFAEKISQTKGAWPGIAVLVLAFFIIRLVIYLEPAIFNFRQFELFNPNVYSSTALQKSLGDLLLNAVFICWLMVFAWSKTRSNNSLVIYRNPWLRFTAGMVCLILLILSTFFIASVIRSMVADSKISFDVTNFFSLDIYSAIGFVVLAGLSLAYYYLTQIIFRILFSVFSPQQTLIVYFAIAVTGLIYLTFNFGDPSVLFYLPVLGWLLLYTAIVQKQGLLMSRFRINIAGIMFWIFVFSASVSLIMLTENRKVEWERRKSYVDKIAEQADPASERLMNIALEYLDEDFLRDNFNRFRDEEKGKKIRDSILNVNYRGYLNKFDTRLYVFDETRKPLFNNDAMEYEALDFIYTQQADTTTIPDLKYFETAFDKFKYITKKTVTDTSGQITGSLFIISDPKKFSSDGLYPELFKENKRFDPLSSPIYATAVYSDGQLISQSSKYQFPISITPAEIPRAEYSHRANGDYEELWHRAPNNKVVVMSRKRESWIEAISLFSYMFCAFLFLVLGVQVISFIIRTGMKWQHIREQLQLNIRSQIHSTVIFVSLLSFVIIFFATMSFFRERYLRNNNDKLSRTMRIMVNEVQKKQADLSVFDDVIKVYDSVSLNKLQDLADEISDIHGIDVNVYDMDGNLRVSSEANVYSRGVLSKKMNPLAYYELSKKRLVHYVQEEKIGKLTYLSIYAPVRDEAGQVYAYLNIPYFALQRELEQDISNFLVTIINLNAFIFLIAGVIALFVTNRITHSFSLISDKMKEVNLGSRNEEITWNRKDEIGELVKEYNKMVAKLGESAAALAKSEREGAWREMARQVAHEIKNPLTPMKLSIQYLQKSIDSNQPNVKELSANVAKTLVEQIDHLSKIAFDFSQFANIGNTHEEFFDLHDVLQSMKDLYQSNPHVDFEWKAAGGKAILYADKTQMNRLFNNLLANAVEACTDKTRCRITVNEARDNGRIRISITDNGEGIPDEMQSKIFVPNFTTKTSGTGLGLAMCKGIAEQAKGTIWFETEVGRGTTFHVELPVAN